MPGSHASRAACVDMHATFSLQLSPGREGCLGCLGSRKQSNPAAPGIGPLILCVSAPSLRARVSCVLRPRVSLP